MTEETETKETPAAPAGPTAAVDEKKEEVKPLLLSVYAQLQYLCPACGEVVLATDEGSTKDGINELELTSETEYRAELPNIAGTCDTCKIPVYREKVILLYHGKRII